MIPEARRRAISVSQRARWAKRSPNERATHAAALQVAAQAALARRLADDVDAATKTLREALADGPRRSEDLLQLVAGSERTTRRALIAIGAVSPRRGWWGLAGCSMPNRARAVEPRPPRSLPVVVAQLRAAISEGPRPAGELLAIGRSAAPASETTVRRALALAGAVLLRRGWWGRPEHKDALPPLPTDEERKERHAAVVRRSRGVAPPVVGAMQPRQRKPRSRDPGLSGALADRAVSARVLVLDAYGHELADVAGIERATAAARRDPTAIVIIGIGASGSVSMLARCAHGLNPPSEADARRAVERWRSAKDPVTSAGHPEATGGAAVPDVAGPTPPGASPPSTRSSSRASEHGRARAPSGSAAGSPSATPPRQKRHSRSREARTDTEAARTLMLDALADGQAHPSAAIIAAMRALVAESTIALLRTAAGVRVARTHGSGGRSTSWQLGPPSAASIHDRARQAEGTGSLPAGRSAA